MPLNIRQHLGQPLQHRLIAITHHQKPALLQRMRAPAVVLRLFRHFVNFAIDFHYHPSGQAHEIHDVIVNGVLPPKARA